MDSRSSFAGILLGQPALVRQPRLGVFAALDQRIATRILELRDELSATRDEVRSLRTQIEQLMHGLSQGLSLAHSQSARATQAALQSSVAALRSR